MEREDKKVWEAIFGSHRECHWFLADNLFGDKDFCVIKKSWKLKRYMKFLPERKGKPCTQICELFMPECMWDYSRNPNDILKEMKENAKKRFR